MRTGPSGLRQPEKDLRPPARFALEAQGTPGLDRETVRHGKPEACAAVLRFRREEGFGRPRKGFHVHAGSGVRDDEAHMAPMIETVQSYVRRRLTETTR